MLLVEAGINRYLKLDPEVLSKLAVFNGKVIKIEITGTGKTFYLFPGEQGISINTDYDGDAGTAIFYMDGVNADNPASVIRTLTTGTVISGDCGIGVAANYTGTHNITGEIGYFGYGEVYLTNPTDFYHPSNGLQELDEITWVEWGGSAPAFWKATGKMDENDGSGANLLAHGTITGPA